MYSYYGLPDDVRQALGELEQELRRPVFVHLSPIAHGACARSSLTETREALEMPYLTFDQSAELGVLLAFSAPEDGRFVGTSRERLAGVNVDWHHVPEDEPFKVLMEGHERPLAYVRDRLVVCAVEYLPYLHHETHRETFDESEAEEAWRLLADALRTSVSDDLRERLAEARRERIRTRVADTVRRTHESAITDRRAQIASLEGNLVSYEQNTRLVLSQLRTQSQELELLLKMREEDTASALLDEFDKLVAHPRVVDVDLRASSKLEITTDPVVMTHPTTGETRWLGRFKMTIDVNTTRVTLKNLDNPRHGRDHPHVNAGSPCFGGHERQFSELVAQGRWSVFLELIFQYLETFNPRDDWGKHAAYWFGAPDVDPDAPQQHEAEERTVVLTDENGEDVYEGDLVSFYDESGHYADGRVVADEDGYVVVRSDGEIGGGRDGGWIMTDSTEVTLLERATTAPTS